MDILYSTVPMYRYTCIRVNVQVYMYTSLYTDMHVYKSIYRYTCIQVCIQVYKFIYMYTSLYSGIIVYIQVYMYSSLYKIFQSLMDNETYENTCNETVNQPY